jgi:hypothetical protein
LGGHLGNLEDNLFWFIQLGIYEAQEPEAALRCLHLLANNDWECGCGPRQGLCSLTAGRAGGSAGPAWDRVSPHHVQGILLANPSLVYTLDLTPPFPQTFSPTPLASKRLCPADFSSKPILTPSWIFVCLLPLSPSHHVGTHLRSLPGHSLPVLPGKGPLVPGSSCEHKDQIHCHIPSLPTGPTWEVPPNKHCENETTHT